MVPLVEEYGVEEVSRAGMDALGYPPIMAHTMVEALAVQSKLREYKK